MWRKKKMPIYEVLGEVYLCWMEGRHISFCARAEMHVNRAWCMKRIPYYGYWIRAYCVLVQFFFNINCSVLSGVVLFVELWIKKKHNMFSSVQVVKFRWYANVSVNPLPRSILQHTSNARLQNCRYIFLKETSFWCTSPISPCRTQWQTQSNNVNNLCTY